MRASHGSSGASSPRRAVKITFTRNTSTDNAMTNAPIVAIRLSASQPMPLGYVYVRRGPSKPRKCIGKNVRLKPMTISQKLSLPSVSSSILPKTFGYQ